MKLLLSRSLFAAFLVVAGYASSFAQTTVTLPTIPCSNCNGPGAFATTAPGCTPALVGAPLTMSWGAASGATSYTIMIATDATMSQNVAAYTQIGTSLSVPAIALMPSTTYYWTVFANSAAGSTRATGGVCSFITNTTWTGTTPTSGFPNGSLNDQMLANQIAGGYSTCQKGDGTCASGDNLVCNPKFQTVSPNSSPFVPNWRFGQSNNVVGEGYYINTGVPGIVVKGVNLGAAGAGIPSTGTQTGVELDAAGGGGGVAITPMYLSNSGTGPVSYQLSLWIKAVGVGNYPYMAAALTKHGDSVSPPNSYGSLSYPVNTTIPYSGSWTEDTRTITIPVGGYANYLHLQVYQGDPVWVTDVRLCKL